MTDKDKLNIQKQLIIELKDENKILQEKVENLTNENNLLTTKQTDVEKEIVFMRNELNTILGRYTELIKHCEDIEKEYQNAVDNYKKITTNYEFRFNRLLQRMK